MTCRLCLKEKPLLKKSHIIPDFMYQRLYDPSHKLNKLAPQSYVKGNRKVLRPSSGEYDSDLLCQDCDNILLGRLETYGKHVLYAKRHTSDAPIREHGQTETGIPVTRYSKVDYSRFKLFLLSILWRAGISKRPFFKEITLGQHEDKLRAMLFEGNPGSQDDFPILLFSWAMDDSIPHDFVAQPAMNLVDGALRFVFIVAGMTYVFGINPSSFPAGMLPFTILPTNTFAVLYIPKGKGLEFFSGYFGIKR